MPAFNEESTIQAIIKKIDQVDLHGLVDQKELIVVDDGSTDKTFEIVSKLQQSYHFISLLQHSENRGKGEAIKTAAKKATGDIFIIQDADLEYDPEDYLACIRPIISNKAEVVYGNRFNEHNVFIRYRMHWFCSKLLNLLVLLLYGHKLDDEATGYKVFSAKLFNNTPLTGKGFEWEPEITAKILKKGVAIHQVPIRYYPRSFDEGKKISWKDGMIAIWTLFKYRIMD